MASADTGEWLERVGLCSVTLRHLDPTEVLAVAAAAGLRRVEWGADVHAPVGDDGLGALAAATSRAGLAVASYGTYWRAGVSPLAEVPHLVAAAQRLGAPRLRVWAGELGTAEADDAYRERVTAALREACAVAGDAGLHLATEFHPRTLTDSVDSTLALVERVGDERLRTYWQPRLDEPAAAAVDGLERLLPVLAGVHVFSWWPGATRLRLAERGDLWRGALDLLRSQASPVDLLLEFVPDDDPAVVGREAEVLRSWVEQAGTA
jgi:hypothetical protein